MEPTPTELPKGTVTFLFTDIERSTDLARRLGAEFAALRSEHRRVLREAFAEHDGHEIDTAGDGFFVAFERAGEAVAAAVAAQRALTELPVPGGAELRVRMGIHTAEPYLDEDGYVGVGVHRAARICAVGHGGQILLSNATAGVVEDLRFDGVGLRDLGEHHLKDMERPQHLFQVDVEGLASDFPELASLHAGGGIVTLVATDLVAWRDVLRRLGDDEAAAAASRYRAIIAAAVEAHDGRIAEAVADNVMAVFARPRDAIRSAIAFRDALRFEPWIDEDHRCGLRCAVHSGRMPITPGKHLGSAALHVAILCDAAEAWQVLVSHATEALLEGEVRGFELVDLGERTIANPERAERIFAVSD